MKNLDKCVFDLGKRYLGILKGMSAAEVQSRFLTLPARKTTVQEIYRTLLGAATGGNLGPGVFQGLIGGIDNLNTLLLGFAPLFVSGKYNGDAGAILLDIVSHFNLRKTRTKKGWHKNKDGTRAEYGGELVGRPGGMLDKLSRIIRDGATLLVGYTSATDFYNHLDAKRDAFRLNHVSLSPAGAEIEAKFELAEYLHGQVYNLGLALALNFLKDISYGDYIKPDVHVVGVFTAFSLSRVGDPPVVFRDAYRVAKNARTTAYAIDKMCWHIGEHKAGERTRFVKWAKEEIRAGRC